MAVTLQPVDVIDVDAAILFSDLLVPFTPMGLRLRLRQGRRAVDREPDPRGRRRRPAARFEPREALAHVLETIRLLRRELEGRVPLIGFGGAPFTLAAYAIEGGPSTTYARTKAFMYAQPAAWHRLCDRFADMMADYLEAQVEAGVQALQIFDSWAGALGAATIASSRCRTRRASSPRSHSSGVPLIHFGVGTTAILPDMAQAGGDVIGLDWRQPLDEAWAIVGHDRAVQGNLDPTLLLGPRGPAVCRGRRRAAPRGRPRRPHLQSRPRRAAEYVARAGPGARAARARIQAVEVRDQAQISAQCL